VRCTFNSRPSTTYQLDFYAKELCDPTGAGEGQLWLGATNVTTDAAGNAALDVTLAAPLRGRFITATATDPQGNTSEFSPCVRASSTIPPATFTVVNTNNSGPGSLRQALLDAMARISAGNNLIAFNLPGSGVQTIAPQSALPRITEPVTIDAFTQPGASANTSSNGNNALPRVRLDGVNAGGASSGLVIAGGNSIIRGLVIVRFGDHGILLTNAGGNRTGGNWIGIDTDNTNQANALSGVVIDDSPNNVIGGSTPAARKVISGNTGRGVFIDNAGASNNLVQGNFICTRLFAETNLPNLGGGVEILDAPRNRVLDNVISGNLGPGVEINGAPATGNVVQGNGIGTDASGTARIPNTGYGVYIHTSASGNSIGGTNTGAGNRIAFNGDDGVYIQAGTNNAIRANSISTNGTALNQLGIDLGVNGVTPNDTGDADGGANQLQNWPCGHQRGGQLREHARAGRVQQPRQ
jgi:hypothetical protein